MMSPPRRQRRWLNRAWTLLVLTPLLWLANLSAARADDVQAPPAALSWMEIADSRGISAWDYDMSFDRGGVTSPLKMIWAFIVDFIWQIYRGIVGFVVWLIDWTLSFQWLGPLEGPAQALSDSLTRVIDRFGLVPLLLTTAALIGVIYLIRGAMATGLYEILMAAGVAALAAGVFANPLGMATGSEGWLAQTRDLGLQVGGALRADNSTANADPDEVRQAISEDLVDIFIRLPQQLVNYNTILDGTECEDTYDAAIQMSHATWVPGTVENAGGDREPGLKLVDSNGDPIKLPPGTDLGDLYDIADDKVSTRAAWGDVPDARSIVATCNEYAGEVAENPSWTQFINAAILGIGGLFLAVLALVLCGGVWVSVVHTMWLAVKALWNMLTGILPGGQRFALMRTAADIVISLALVVFAMVFLVAYLQLVLAVFVEMDGSPTMKFAVLDILLLAGTIVYVFYRRRAKASSNRLASTMSTRPGPPPKSMPSPRQGLGRLGGAPYYFLGSRSRGGSHLSPVGRAGTALRRSVSAGLKGKDLGPHRVHHPDGMRPLTRGGRPPRPPGGSPGSGRSARRPDTNTPAPGAAAAAMINSSAAAVAERARRPLAPGQAEERRTRSAVMKAQLGGPSGPTKRPRIAGEEAPGKARRERIRPSPKASPHSLRPAFKRVVGDDGRINLAPRSEDEEQ